MDRGQSSCVQYVEGLGVRGGKISLKTERRERKRREETGVRDDKTRARGERRNEPRVKQLIVLHTTRKYHKYSQLLTSCCIFCRSLSRSVSPATFPLVILLFVIHHLLVSTIHFRCASFCPILSYHVSSCLTPPCIISVLFS